MYCRNCGHEIENLNKPCTYCESLPLSGKNYCQECGFPTTEDQIICSSCQERLKYAEILNDQKQNTQYFSHQQHNINEDNEDKPNTLANIAACCSIPFTGIPIVGLIIYLIWKDEKPNAAESVCLWSLFPFLIILVIYIIFIIFGVFSQLFHYLRFSY